MPGRERRLAWAYLDAGAVAAWPALLGAGALVCFAPVAGLTCFICFPCWRA